MVFQNINADPETGCHPVEGRGKTLSVTELKQDKAKYRGSALATKIQ